MDMNEPVMRLRARVRKVTGNTRHWIGLPDAGGIELERLPNPVIVEVVGKGGGFYLFRLDSDNHCIADTWHETVELAKAQAAFEFAVEENDWSAE